MSHVLPRHPQATKPKGPQVAVENPNRVVQKNKKLSTLSVEGATKEPAQLSRRERSAELGHVISLELKHPSLSRGYTIMILNDADMEEALFS